MRTSLQTQHPETTAAAQSETKAQEINRQKDPVFIQRKCAHCEEEENAQRKEMPPFLQRKESTAAGGTASDTVSSGVQSSKGGGNRMDASTKSFMERGLGADFSGVNIHTDSKAADMNTELQARAFTVGSDIYFNEGQYQPQSSEGKRLLAHELTHTMQQGNVVRRDMPKDPFGRPLGFVPTPEQEAYDRETYEINQWKDALERLGKGQLDDRDLANARLRNRLTGLSQQEVETLITQIQTWQTTNPKLSTSKIVEWLEVRKVIATPMPDGATVNRNPITSLIESFSFTDNGVLVIVKPNVSSSGGNETTVTTNFPTRVSFKGDRSGKVTELNDTSEKTPVPFDATQLIVTIETQFGQDLDMQSQYGKGTQQYDKEEKTTTLRVHEGKHGTDFISFIKSHKLSVNLSGGIVGVLTTDDLSAVFKYIGDISSDTCEATDQVGFTQDEFLKTAEGKKSKIVSCRKKKKKK